MEKGFDATNIENYLNKLKHSEISEENMKEIFKILSKNNNQVEIKKETAKKFVKTIFKVYEIEIKESNFNLSFLESPIFISKKKKKIIQKKLEKNFLKKKGLV